MKMIKLDKRCQFHLHRDDSVALYQLIFMLLILITISSVQFFIKCYLINLLICFINFR